jgi:hypothetical protein
MSGFVEKLFDSFTGQDNNQQQQQQPQQVQRPWISQWDDRENRYVYINEDTGERSWTPPQQGKISLSHSFLLFFTFPCHLSLPSFLSPFQRIPPSTRSTCTQKLTCPRFLPRCRRMDWPPCW